MTGPLTGMRITGVFPHPDDEAYAAGGMLAMCARDGATVSIVSATRGEGGRVRGRGTPSRDEMAALRTAELEASCRVLGAEPPRFLDLPDGGLDQVGIERGAAAIAGALAELEPHVVVTLGDDGVYGHRDHIACTKMVAQATSARVLHAVFPRGVFEPVWRLVRKARAARLVVDIDAAAIGVDPADVDLSVDIGSVRALKLAAIAAHDSQLAGGNPRSFLRPNLIDALLDVEWYIVAFGPPLPRGSDHPFAGL
jgi:LmbE family N-acetylglucosaminyl deacetylase